MKLSDPWSLTTLIFVALLGHVMACFWYLALVRGWSICKRTIYDLPIDRDQIRREIKNSVHTPIHAVLLAMCVYLGWFPAVGWLSFLYSLAATVVWAEIWHYGSHRAFHLKPLHWIHAEHHRSHLNTPFTAISFAFAEKLIFDFGMLGGMALLNLLVPVNLFGVAAWFVIYLIVNSFSHANFELKSASYNAVLGKVFTSTTYHSLHHSRYTGNYGLGTRFLDRWFNTEWEDYERLYDRVNRDRQPLKKLAEKVNAP